MNSESATNGVASFLRLSRPINFSPLHISAAVQTTHLAPVLANRNFQLAAFSTGLIGTGLALSAFYPGFFNGGHRRYNMMANDPFTPLHWLEYPADYAPPVMDLFVEDRVPFGVSSPLSCPKGSEHLERVFYFLRYQYLSKKLGVPSVINRRTPIRLLRILGNTSSGSSLDFLAVANLARFNPSIQGGASGSTGGDKNDYPRIINSTRRPLVAGDEELKREPVSYWTGIITASIIVTIVGLLARAHRSSPPSTTSEKTPEVQEAGSDNRDDNNVYCKDCQCAPVPIKEPSTVLRLGIFIDPKYLRSVERLFEDDPLAETYIPLVVLKFLDVYSPVWSDFGSLENAPAPDGFAARFDAPQVALLIFQALRNMVEHLPEPLDVARYIVFGTAIFLCFALRVIGFLFTGRFGRRGIKKLIKGFKGAKPSSATLEVKTANDETLPLQLVETPARQENIPPVGCSENSSVSSPCAIDAGMQEAYERIVTAMITPKPSCSTTTSAATLVNETVETSLAPVVDQGNFKVRDDADNTSFQKGKAIIPGDKRNPDKVAESIEPPERVRGRRGHGRGRRSPAVA